MAANVNLAPLAKQQFNQNGVPVAGGKLYTYAAGTMTKLATYTDSTGVTPNTNPIILDANGQCDCWLVAGSSYKFILSPSTDTDPPTNPYWTEDNLFGSGDFSTATKSYIQSGALNYAVDTGTTANAYVVTLTPAIPTTIPDGFPINVYVTPARVNTGAATLNGVAIVDRNGNPILGGQIVGMCAIEYSSAYAKWMFTSGNFIPTNGTTSQRPTVAAVGQQYLDTTLGQPIWCISASPVTWINAAGVSV